MNIQTAAEQTVERVRLKLGDAEHWARRVSYGYPDSLALCVIDSIQSIGVRYSSVEKVVRRYRKADKSGNGRNADGLLELLAMIAEYGGSAGWRVAVGNNHKTSSHKTAIYKAEAIELAARVLVGMGVSKTAQLRAVGPANLEQVKRTWLTIPGQRSGISWRYMLMLAGAPGVKPDRMILRFVAAATGIRQRDIDVNGAADVVTEAATLLGSTPTELDHAIWSWQRTQGKL